MRIGFIGLGRMGANMVRRLLLDGHEVVAYNRTPEKTTEIAGEGAIPSFSIAELVGALAKPRAVWVMVPAGDATEAQIAELLEHLEPGDTIIDGGNTNFHDDLRRHKALAEHGIAYIDAGTSGGTWGLKLGYCLMVGGDAAAVDPLVPIFTSLAPADGYRHVGGPGAGHYVKMVHNGIEYGLMQAYAEGFEIMHASDYELDLAAISELWMQGSVVRSWLLELAGRARTTPTGPRCWQPCATSSAATPSRPNSPDGGSSDQGQRGRRRAATQGHATNDEGAAPESPDQAPVPAENGRERPA